MPVSSTAMPAGTSPFTEVISTLPHTFPQLPQLVGSFSRSIHGGAPPAPENTASAASASPVPIAPPAPVAVEPAIHVVSTARCAQSVDVLPAVAVVSGDAPPDDVVPPAAIAPPDDGA